MGESDIENVLALAASVIPAEMRTRETFTADDGFRVKRDVVMRRVFAASAVTRFFYCEEDVETIARLLEEWEEPAPRTHDRTRYRERAVRYLETLGMLPESKQDALGAYVRNG
ncbi:hypothetical protein [Nesterenkonia massiliensis]|uniref:hypothetical protein n=1 Tax=Nesterenkonia massiliensis TaxID=1232429 RepID=UPI0011CC1D57|nr:hypothetical protein [Nesterenkonia massiliensis]